jgi:hypothetical protein
MRDAAAFQRVFERARDGLLTEDVIEGLRAPLAG